MDYIISIIITNILELFKKSIGKIPTQLEKIICHKKYKLIILFFNVKIK